MDYFDGDRGNSEYQRDRSQSQVNFAEVDSNYYPIELELGDIAGRHTDSEADGYLANRRADKEFSGAERAGGCDVFKTFAKENMARKYDGENERAGKRFGKHLWKCEK